ncbi:MAG TPA: M28 family peptidase [Solirubrobacteraceae bacterium]|nr:M28 family peptidase [Solirubrobacteraceae bacterium]
MAPQGIDPQAVVTGLARLAPRGPGTDAERRAARWLAAVLREDLDRESDVETVWVRPAHALVVALHAAVGVAGSVVAVTRPAVGLGLALAALVSWVLDGLGVVHLGRRLTPARATQNLVSPPTAATRSGRQRIVRLVITAAYDAGRGGLLRRETVRRAVARVRQLTGGRLPGTGTFLAAALAAVAGLAGLRLAGVEGTWVGAVQLVPTVGLMAALALAVDTALSRTAPGAGDPASGAAVAIALAGALDRDPPRHLGVELVLAGAGQGPSLGMREFVRARRRRWRPEATAVLHVAACGRGRPRWWTADGPVVPQRLHPTMAGLAAEIAEDHGARPHRGRGATGAWRARRAGWPAIAVGCLTDEAWPPDANTARDTADRVEPAAMRDALAFALALVRALDEDLAERV